MNSHLNTLPLLPFLPHPPGGVEKVGLSDFFPLCYFVSYFVILCGSMNYVLPQRYTKAITKVRKGLFQQPQEEEDNQSIRPLFLGRRVGEMYFYDLYLHRILDNFLS